MQHNIMNLRLYGKMPNGETQKTLRNVTYKDFYQERVTFVTGENCGFVKVLNTI